MAEHTSSLNVEADIKSAAYLMDQRVINARLDRLESSNARLDRLESSLVGICRAIISFTRSVDRLLLAQAIGVSGSGSDAQMPAPSPSFCHRQEERLRKDQEEKEHEKNEEAADRYTIIKERLRKYQEEKEHEKNEEAADRYTSIKERLRKCLEEREHEKNEEAADLYTIKKERLRKDQEEKEHEKNEEAADLYIITKVARDEDLAQQIGRDIYFDLVDHDKVKCFRIKKQMPFVHFKDEVAQEFGIPVQCLRFWLWAKRQNHSYRPCRPLTPLEETKTVWRVGRISKNAHNEELKLFLEVELGLDLRPMVPPEKTEDDILLFFKLYDPVKEELRYVGRLFVKRFGKPSEILMKLTEMAGYGREEQLILYEEIKFEPSVMCEPIDKEVSYQASELGDGDIICFQKAIRLPDVPSYLRYWHNRGLSFIGVQP